MVKNTKEKAPEVELQVPEVKADPGHKVTTIRLTSTEYDQVAIFAEALGGLSLTEFAGRAIRAYIKACSQDPALRKEIQRQINKQRRALDQFAQQVLGGDDGDEG